MSEKSMSDRMFLKTAKSMLILNGKVHPGLVAQMPPQLLKGAQNGDGDAGDDAPVDAVLLLAMNRKELEQSFAQAKRRLGDKGSLWVAYLKPTASKATDLTRDDVSAYAKEQGITTVAAISIDGDWSALRMKRIEI
jgi:hypothetical protein